ncbi:MAG: heparan-alpha-glucosaminide N-acetyltransferase domain-containing protein [Candidatus Kryptonium sp.]|nr:DUF1624 domain-containing protein [Candidatus Kryptonium sp.]MCX7762421.1 DUF1624 domain-containing protein [Candidatus Kryptonium sp.]MDW8109856.1 heparan-alpha-glucosaminide N-acetyltransferase domain-containing protein [Candidatus Kryptonium sp.]
MSGRLRFIDVFRGLAILLMLHGHTADALLNPVEKSSLAFQIYTIFRGFTAPMFLFISGFAFSITTLKYVEEYSRFSEKFLKRIRKFLFIIFLGYFLHLPYLSLRKLISESNFEVLSVLFSSDVLQVIGVSLLSLQLALFLFKDANKFSTFSLLAGIFVFLISPLLFMIDFSKFLPLFLSQYLNTFHGSKFPLFPWAGYILFGVYIGHMFMVSANSKQTEIFFNKILKISLFVFPITLILQPLSEIILNPNQFLIYSSPFLSFSRLSFVIIVFYIVWRIESVINLKFHPLQVFGVESLFVYVVHLMIIYGSPINPTLSFSAFWREMLSYPQVFTLFLILAMTMFLSSYLLNIAKWRNYRTVDYLRYAIANIILLVFLINPY